MVAGPNKDLENLERMMYWKTTLKAWSCFLVGAKLNEKLETDDILKGIHKLFTLRVQLRLNVFQYPKKRFVTEEINGWSDDFVDFVDYPTDDFDIIEAFKQQHNQYFELGVQKPLWKLVVLNHQYLVILCDHTLYDGNTALYICEDLITILNDRDIPVDRIPDIKPYHDLLKPKLGHTIKTVIQTFAPKWAYPLVNLIYRPKSEFETGAYDDWGVTHKIERTTNKLKHLITITNEEFSIIKKLTKSHGVNFTAFWAYINVLAVAQLGKSAVDLSIPFNMRTNLLPPEYLRWYGLLVSHVTLNVHTKVDHDSIDWDFVRFLNGSVAHKYQVKQSQMLGMIKYVSARGLIESALKSPRKGGLEVSNLGLRVDPDGESWKKYTPEEFFFSLPNDLSGYNVSNAVISSKTKTNIILDGVPEFANEFPTYANNVETILRNAINGYYE
ncbi:N-acetyltransferase SLI1 [Wickerhamomyces ciferrii]|uniref:N-acetyltransferase SLI1 n=1 Tax=Wickerhamomyces ciferrii (strain ATCC 14091 / BCRC 22168 / CBS 111 / JCM 3599 / NBRC 0793 / NRRL Y-1031 F-60-10) TaxID=1206466 RepID=K0KN92_WICCF|nr:N-acetyltransferase SLI1 [Wickerhamomyces ciferrii]CCH46725.1 N-acetyltransferase SLI1 [Wickerhamomyces ciferrii]